MCLPKNMMMPVSASATNEIAVVQCAARSTALKRSISRPGGGFTPDSALVASGCAGLAGACASAPNGSASTAPTMKMPSRDVRSIMVSPLASGLGVARTQVFVLVVRANREGLLVLDLVALEEIACIGLGVFLAGVGLRRILRNLVACARDESHCHPEHDRFHALPPPGWSASLPLPP